MFSDIEKNKKMIEGAFRKIKSYYYYNKNFMIVRDKIASAENNEETFQALTEKIALYLSQNGTVASKEYFKNLVDSIDVYAIPKKFEAPEINNDDPPISNILSKQKKMTSINLFIDMPIELHMIETIWTLFLARIAKEERTISQDVYGNIISDSLFSCDYDESINFDSNRMFSIYFHQYSKWRNGAFRRLEENYDTHKDSVLIAIDIKNFFYSVEISQKYLFETFGNNLLFESIKPLTDICIQIFHKYKQELKKYRTDISFSKSDEYPLPIGLFSSMLLANVYLSHFDKYVTDVEDVSYYGRYVDDLLFVFQITLNASDNNKDVITKTLIRNNLLSRSDDHFSISGQENLHIQKDKVKVLYIDHNESKAFIDIYNNTIKIIPSQMNPMPDYRLNITSFDESAYTIENFTKEKKIRDIGRVDIDSFKVSHFFSSLIQKFSHMDSYGSESTKREIQNNINEIKQFLSGGQCIEYYTVWNNYMYFLVMTQRSKDLKEFYNKVISIILETSIEQLDKHFINRETLSRKIKEFLLQYLESCLLSGLALDIEMAGKFFIKKKSEVNKYINANMFNHSLIALPLTNYLCSNFEVSFLKMKLQDLSKFFKMNARKIDRSPRFIHYDEILLLSFYERHMKDSDNYRVMRFENTEKRFTEINHISCDNYPPFYIGKSKQLELDRNLKDGKYRLNIFRVPDTSASNPSKLNVAVANIKLDTDVIFSFDRWKGLSFDFKEMINDILMEAYKHSKEDVKILVLPELCLPIYWIGEVIKFSKNTQIAVITGIQYVDGENSRAYNYVATILPFLSKRKYRNAFIHIREKNDYSPLEMDGLAWKDRICEDSETAEYQIFEWKGIRLTTFLCYEFTDVVARSLTKGLCDIIALPVYNRDTNYFSSMIEASVRDLHAFVAQSNTSEYGDSRICAPYDRDSKDIVKIKGGENNFAVIGTIDFQEYKEFQKNYYMHLQGKINDIREKVKRGEINISNKKKAEIKPLSARYRNKGNDTEE